MYWESIGVMDVLHYTCTKLNILGLQYETSCIRNGVPWEDLRGYRKVQGKLQQVTRELREASGEELRDQK
jgi:hypothetical protein